MSPRPKAEIMAELSRRRRAAGLAPATVWVRPEDRKRLAKYVHRQLKGEYTPQPARGEREDSGRS